MAQLIWVPATAPESRVRVSIRDFLKTVVFSAFLAKFQRISVHFSAFLCKVFALNFLKNQRTSAHFFHIFFRKFLDPGSDFKRSQVTITGFYSQLCETNRWIPFAHENYEIMKRFLFGYENVIPVPKLKCKSVLRQSSQLQLQFNADSVHFLANCRRPILQIVRPILQFVKPESPFFRAKNSTSDLYLSFRTPDVQFYDTLRLNWFASEAFACHFELLLYAWKARKRSQILELSSIGLHLDFGTSFGQSMVNHNSGDRPYKTIEIKKKTSYPAPPTVDLSTWVINDSYLPYVHIDVLIE